MNTPAMAVTVIASAVVTFSLALPAWANAGEDPGLDARIEAVVETLLTERPELLDRALARLEVWREAQARARDAARVAEHAEMLREGFGTPAAGNPDATVTVVEFLDYRCGYCRRVAPDVKALIAGDPDVRVVYMELPILGPRSDEAARAALAAARQGAYAPMHDALMSTDIDPPGTIESVARTLGLDMERFARDREDPAFDETIARTRVLARALGITGTPGFVIGTRIVRGAMPRAALERAVTEARDAGERDAD